MPIIDLQRRLAEVGRLRIGQRIPIGKTGKTRPTKLDTFRLTSPDQPRIECAAKLYGGTPQPWDAPTGPQWEVITETTTLPVTVPPGDIGLTQWMELWAGGGCQRRCNTNQATYIDNGNLVDGDCLCDPDNRECKPHTRLSVMLRDLPGIGLWRLDTQGYYAAVELAGAVDILETARHLGVMIPAELRLDQRMIKRPGQTTRRFAVPVLDPAGITPGQLAAPRIPRALAAPLTINDIMDSDTPELITADDLLDSDDPELAVLAYGRARARAREAVYLTPVPPDPDTPPGIADQISPPPARPRRGQTPIPATGLRPRTAAQAATPTSPAEAEQPELPSSPGRRPPPEPEISDPRWPTPLPPDVINTLDTIDTAREPGPNQTPLWPDEPRVIDRTSPEWKLLQTLFREQFGDDAQAKHDFAAAALNQPIESSKDLTPGQVSELITILKNDRPNDESQGKANK